MAGVIVEKAVVQGSLVEGALFERSTNGKTVVRRQPKTWLIKNLKMNNLVK